MFMLALLQLCLTAFTFAAPLAGDAVGTMGHHDNSMQYGAGGGVLGFIVLVLDIIVWIEVLKSNRPPSHKLLWSVLVFIFPVVGIIIYWLFSDRQKHNNGAGYEPITS